jgi:hypothetical protein
LRADAQCLSSCVILRHATPPCARRYTDTIGEQADELTKIFDCILDPMLQMCTLSASSLPPIRSAVYSLNCIYQIHTILSVYENTEKWTEQLAEQSAGDAFRFAFAHAHDAFAALLFCRFVTRCALIATSSLSIASLHLPLIRHSSTFVVTSSPRRVSQRHSSTFVVTSSPCRVSQRHSSTPLFAFHAVPNTCRCLAPLFSTVHVVC